jgi:hypothetical protein
MRPIAHPARRAAGAVLALLASGITRTGGLAPAFADDGERDAVGAVIVGGGAGDHDRRVVSAAVAVAARESGWSLPRDTVTAQEADRLLDCGDPHATWAACVPASIAGRGVHQIFVFAVERNESDSGAPMVVLTARLIVSAPQALVVRQRFCEHCADDRLTAASIDLARQLLQDLAVRTGRTILEVESSPTGARITIDGQPIGATNATFNTFPGSHVVVVEKLGYRAATRSVIAEEGKTAAVAVALVPSDGRPPVRSSHRLAGALIGGGALAVVAAGVLLELGARGGPGHPDDKYRYAGATPAGALIGGAGLAAIATGLYQWLRAPAANPGPGPGGKLLAGWSIAF